jgi:hypothetical protein
MWIRFYINNLPDDGIMIPKQSKCNDRVINIHITLLNNLCALTVKK